MEAGTEDVQAEQAGLLGCFDRMLEPGHSQGVFGPDIDIAVMGTGRDGGDQHTLNHQMGIALHDAAIHESTGVPFITIADNVFDRILLPGNLLPFPAGRITATATAAQVRLEYGLADRFRSQLKQRLAQRLVASMGDIVFNRIGIDRTALLEHDAGLLAVKGDIILAGKATIFSMVHQPFNR